MPQAPFPEQHLNHLQATLDDALRCVPVYARWKERDREAPVLDRLRGMPTLTRKELRLGFPRQLTPNGRDLKQALDAGEVEIVATSGTTDDRVQVLWWQPWWDQQEEAQYLTGHTLAKEIWARGFREAVLTTPVCAGAVCHIGDAPMADRTIGRMLFLNQKADPAHWTERDLKRMVEELATYAPDALEADPAYLAAVARYALAHNIRLHQPRYIGLTYEFISRLHLRAIRAAFGESVEIINSYGSTEAGCLHLSCEHGRLHPNLNWTHTDVIPLQTKHGGPSLGRLVASVLQNPWLRLLRYETGDLVRLAEGPCACGREGESLSRIEGRLKDATFATDGGLRTVEAVDAAIGDLPGLEGYQLMQEAPARYLLRYIPEAGASDERLQHALRERITALYGGGELHLSRETAIAPEQSGKYRLSRSAVAFDPMSLF